MLSQGSVAERDQLTRGIADTKARLVGEFGGLLDPGVIERLVDDTFNALQDATVREFVPLFVYRAAREQLAGMAQTSAI